MSEDQTDSGTNYSSTNGKLTSQKPNSSPPANEFPLLYTSLVLINSDAHAGLKLKQPKDYSFAKSAASIVLAAAEFAEAAAHYPIVFGRSGDDLVAYVVTGHTAGHNLYLDINDAWRSDTYIPAYIRRYPFLLMETKEDNKLSLLADLESGLLTEDKGEPLYANDQPTDTAQKALQFCLNYHQEILRSANLFKQIDDAGLLIERNADVTLPDSKQARISGFHVVDEEKLRDLDDDTFLELRRSGALTLIYCQLWSMRSWGNLLG